MSRRACAAMLVVCLGVPAFAAQPQFWRIEGHRDFLDGDLEGLSVDSDGRVRLAPASRLLHNPEAPFVWSLARDKKGTLYAGTGNDGKVFRIQGELGSTFFDAGELEVHALAHGPDDRLYVGTSPDGKVYAVDADGRSETFYDPPDRYIWALAFDGSGNLYVATGSEARVHRVNRKGEAQIVLTSPETHITALATDAKSQVFAGSAPNGVLYRLDAAGKVFVLHDSSYREVKAVGVGPDGSVYAALVDGREKEDGRAPAPVLLPPVPAAAPVEATDAVTVTVAAAPPSPSPSPAARVPEPARAGPQKGALVRVLPTGEVDTLWSSADETPYALLAGPQGALLGTGAKGHLYRIRDDRTWSMLATLPGEQVTALAPGPDDGAILATSNPGRVFALEGKAGASGSFVAKLKDTETVSTWGRIRWEASVPPGTRIEVMTRAGNTATPDTTWTAWSTPYAAAQGEPVRSERARFLQVKAVLHGKDGASPVLDSLATAYLQRNLRPQVTSITVHPAGEIFQRPLSVTGEVDVLGLEPGSGVDVRGPVATARPAPPPTSFARRLYQRGLQTFTWRAEDPNGDTLTYEIHYRVVGETRFRLLRKGLTEPVLAWDTSTVPNGRYVLRVTAADAQSNPESLALTGDKESAPFDVDNAPPGVVLTLAQRAPLRVRAVVRDESSMVRRAEYSVDGGRWQEVHPIDGINDAPEETYEIALEGLTAPGPHALVVRATDLLGNIATARLEIP